jgi:hypothetical protein
MPVKALWRKAWAMRYFPRLLLGRGGVSFEEERQEVSAEGAAGEGLGRYGRGLPRGP